VQWLLSAGRDRKLVLWKLLDGQPMRRVHEIKADTKKDQKQRPSLEKIPEPKSSQASKQQKSSSLSVADYSESDISLVQEEQKKASTPSSF